MKLLPLFTLLIALVVFGCTKSNNENTNLMIDNNPLVANYSTAIVGKWQLSEIGTTSNTNQEITWTKATANEILTFDCMGGFIKDLKGDALCKGLFQIDDGVLTLNSNCGDETNTVDMTRMTMIVKNQNQSSGFKYARLE